MKIDCLPNNEFSDCKYKADDFFVYDSYDILNAACVPLSPKAALRFNKISVKFNHGVFGDLMQSWWLYAYCSAISLVLGFVFLVLLCVCAKLLTWFIFIALSTTLMSIGAMLFVHLYSKGPLNNSINAMRIKYLSFLTNNHSYLTILGVVFILVGLMLFVIMIRKCAIIAKST